MNSADVHVSFCSLVNKAAPAPEPSHHIMTFRCTYKNPNSFTNNGGHSAEILWEECAGPQGEGLGPALPSANRRKTGLIGLLPAPSVVAPACCPFCGSDIQGSLLRRPSAGRPITPRNAHLLSPHSPFLNLSDLCSEVLESYSAKVPPYLHLGNLCLPPGWQLVALVPSSAPCIVS